MISLQKPFTLQSGWALCWQKSQFYFKMIIFFLWNSLNKQAHLKFSVDCKFKKCVFQIPSRHLKGESTFPSESFRHLCKDDFKIYTSLFGIGFSFEHERNVNIIPLFWLVFLWSFVEVYKSITIPYGKRMMSYEKNASNVIVFVRAILIVKRRVESLRIGLFAIGSVGWCLYLVHWTLLIPCQL